MIGLAETGKCGCRGVFLQLKEALLLPYEAKEEAQRSRLNYLYSGGERHILPSFFNLLKHLHNQVGPSRAAHAGGHHIPYTAVADCIVIVSGTPHAV
jgi:hypothetical protein